MKILSSFVNLRVLELDNNKHGTCNCLKDMSLPFLEILRVKHVPTNIVSGLIENTNGNLSEVNIYSYIIFNDTVITIELFRLYIKNVQILNILR